MYVTHTSIHQFIYLCVQSHYIVQQSTVQFNAAVQEVATTQKGRVRYVY